MDYADRPVNPSVAEMSVLHTAVLAHCVLKHRTFIYF